MERFRGKRCANPWPARHRPYHLGDELPLLVGRLLKELVGQRAEVNRSAVSGHGGRGTSSNARVDQHGHGEVFDENLILWRDGLVVQVELAPILLPLAPLAQKRLNIADLPVDLACSEDQLHQGREV